MRIGVLYKPLLQPAADLPVVPFYRVPLIYEENSPVVPSMPDDSPYRLVNSPDATLLVPLLACHGLHELGVCVLFSQSLVQKFLLFFHPWIVFLGKRKPYHYNTASQVV